MANLGYGEYTRLPEGQPPRAQSEYDRPSTPSSPSRPRRRRQPVSAPGVDPMPQDEGALGPRLPASTAPGGCPERCRWKTPYRVPRQQPSIDNAPLITRENSQFLAHARDRNIGGRCRGKIGRWLCKSSVRALSRSNIFQAG